MKTRYLFAIFIFSCVYLVFPQSITVTAPISGHYQTGSTIHVHWTSEEITGVVKIILKKVGFSEKHIIKENHPYDQPHSFPIPHSVTPGTYFIKVKQGSSEGKSGNITISQGYQKKGLPTVSKSKPKPVERKKPLIQTMPYIKSRMPDFGPAGANIRVEGRNFGATQGNNQLRIIGPSSSLALGISKWADKYIRATIPANQAIGNFKLKLVNAQNQPISNGIDFKVVNKVLINSITPNSASADQVITLNGRGFGATKSEYLSVKSNIGPTTWGLNDIVSWSDTMIKVRVAMAMARGDHEVFIDLVPFNEFSNRVDFHVNPYIESISPDSGPIGFSTSFIIKGKGFRHSQGSQEIKVVGNGLSHNLSPRIWKNDMIVAGLYHNLPNGAYMVYVSDPGKDSSNVFHISVNK